MQSRVALAVRPRHKTWRQVNRASDIPGVMPDNDPFAARPPFATRDSRWAAALYALSGTPLACGFAHPLRKDAATHTRCTRRRGVAPDFHRRRNSERRHSMKSKTIATMSHLMPSKLMPSKWGGRGRAIPLLRIATVPRTWVFASAAASAGGRAHGRWRTRFALRGRTFLITRHPPGLGLALPPQASPAGAGVAVRGGGP